MRRYRLEKNANGMITQCENNADGGNIYAQRKELKKKVEKNLARPTPGKLGNLSNLQIFNFSVSNFASGTEKLVFQEYNTTVTTANVTQAIQFGVDSINDKSPYYNVLSIKANVNLTNGGVFKLQDDSYIEFYITENIDTSTTSLGRKIARRVPLFGSGGGAVTFTTTGAKQEYQYVSADLNSDSVITPTNTKGIRCSGLALKTIALNFDDDEDVSALNIDFQVFVDIDSASSSF